jgi:CheY-like chemotaxis protein
MMGKHILIVDDEETNVEYFKDLLEVSGYTITVARNGQEAMDMAVSQKPDMILMDVQMPIKDGLAATRELRAQDGFGDLPIIALTALAMTGDREKTLEAGCTDYISKPVRVKDLLAKVAEYLG